MNALLSVDESLRLEALHRLKVLDTEPEAGFDRITALAARLYRTPMATVSLVDADRQWFKSCVNMPSRGTGRDTAFCARTILSEQGLVVPDATQDQRFRHFANVTGPPYIRFYAGWPLLTSDGFAVGSLCVMDSAPRRESIDLFPLQELAAVTSELLETRLLSQRLRSAELARQEAEEQYSLIVSEMRQVAFQIGPDGHWTFLNPAWTRVTGRSIKSTLGEPWFACVHPADEARAQLLWRKLLSGGTPQRESLRFLDRSGAVVWLELTAGSSWRAGSFAGISGTLHDVTERVQNEALLTTAKAEAEAARKSAEAANKAKSTFVASVSHEIRTPLNAILGMAELLSETDLSADQKNYVDVFRRAGTNLLTLINDVLDFSKIEAGRMQLDLVTFDLPKLLRHALDLIRPRLQSKPVTLQLVLPDNLPVRVHGDPLRLEQILINLLGNAVKFTEAGEISLTVRIDSAVYAGRVTFSVRDSGIGIPSDKLATIFDDFEQVESSTTRKYGGTGLGLGIVRRLISLMNGTIGVQSAPGQGTTFTFTVALALPVARESDAIAGNQLPKKGDPKTVRTPAGAGPLRLLIAEDSPDNRILLEAYLGKTGHHFTFAKNGREAVERWAGEKFDLIFMDVQMPLMDGLEATRQIRLAEGQTGQQRTPVVMLTANAASTDLEASKIAGADSHLNKPISKALFLGTIDEYAQKVKSRS